MPKQKERPIIRRIRTVNVYLIYLTYAGAFWLAFGTGPEPVNSVIVVALWTWCGLFFFTCFAVFGVCCFSEHGERISKSMADQRRAERGRWWWLRRLLLFGSIAALFWMGRPALAGLWLSQYLFWLAAVTNCRSIESTELFEAASAPVDAKNLGSATSELMDLLRVLMEGTIVVFQLGMLLAWFVFLVPVVVAAVPLLLLVALAVWVGTLVTQHGLTRVAREIKKAKGNAEGMIYFVYAEPHQRTHFMEPPGVLAPFGTSVLARNWRADLWKGRKDFDSTSEAKLLRHFDISNLKKHLPFVAIIDRRNRVKAIQCNAAYRARMHDSGAALATLEEEIRTAAASAFPD